MKKFQAYDNLLYFIKNCNFLRPKDGTYLDELYFGK